MRLRSHDFRFEERFVILGNVHRRGSDHSDKASCDYEGECSAQPLQIRVYCPDSRYVNDGVRTAQVHTRVQSRYSCFECLYCLLRGQIRVQERTVRHGYLWISR